jgi:hypothetical protein
MDKKWLPAIITGALALAAIAFVVTLFLVKILWAWTIPDLFPGAVTQGLIAKQISWFTAFKIAIFVGVLSGLIHVKTNDSKTYKIN